MTDTGRKTLIYGGAFAVGCVAVYLLWSSRASVTATPTSGMYAQPTGLTTPSFPPASINLSFTVPSPNTTFTNQPTGYVPLFGFIGVGQYGANT